MSTLKEQLWKNKAECHESGASSFVEFQPTVNTRQGFALAQLLHYTLDANTAAELDTPDRLTLAFSTADVVIVGARLVRLSDLVREHKLAVVRTLPDRYRELEPHQAFVAEIIIGQSASRAAFPTKRDCRRIISRPRGARCHFLRLLHVGQRSSQKYRTLAADPARVHRGHRTAQ
jgi:hypothetical protein